MIHNAYVREISYPYRKIYHYLVLCKAKGYMVESYITHSSLRDVLKMSCVLRTSLRELCSMDIFEYDRIS